MNEVLQVGGIAGAVALTAFLWHCRERWARLRPSRIVAEALPIPFIIAFLVIVIAYSDELLSEHFWHGHVSDPLGMMFFGVAGIWLGGVALLPVLLIAKDRRTREAPWPNKIAPPEPPPVIPSSDPPVHRTLDSPPAPASGDGR